MKKRNKLTRSIAAILALVLIVGILFVVRSFYGDPVSKYFAENKLEAYAKQHHDNLTEFTYDGVGYNFKDGSYFASYTNIKQPRLGFSISLQRSGDFYDDYIFNYVEGTNAWAVYANEIYHQMDESIQTTCNETYGYCIAVVEEASISEEDRGKFYQNIDMESLNVITMSGSVQLTDYRNASIVAEQLKSFAALFAGNDQRIKSYSLSIFDETGNSGYEVQNVSKEVMNGEGFLQELEAALQMKHEYVSPNGFFIQMLEEK